MGQLPLSQCFLTVLSVTFPSFDFYKQNLHENKMEFGNLIPGKLCFWREIFAILRENLPFRLIFLSFSWIFSNLASGPCILWYKWFQYCLFSLMFTVYCVSMQSVWTTYWKQERCLLVSCLSNYVCKIMVNKMWCDQAKWVWTRKK